MITLRAFNEAELPIVVILHHLDTPEKIEKFRPRFEATGRWDDHYFNCAVDVDGVVVGEVQARHCPKSMPPGTAEMGLDLLPEFRGKGLGTRILSVLARQLFAEGYHRIAGSTDVTNIAMQRAFEKAGWRYEGTQRHLMPEGEDLPHDYRMYAITKFDEPPAASAE